jgi:hypothetical protein
VPRSLTVTHDELCIYSGDTLTSHSIKSVKLKQISIHRANYDLKCKKHPEPDAMFEITFEQPPLRETKAKVSSEVLQLAEEH